MNSSPISTMSSGAAKIQLANDLPDIAFIGKAGSGKSTLAKALESNLNYTTLSFAGPLKQAAVDLWGKRALTDRGLLQEFGLKMREIDEQVWCNALVRSYHEWRGIEGNEHGFCVDDCRFPNEFDALKGEGFVIIRVSAPRELRKERLLINGKLQDETQLDHESETALDDYAGHDYEIDGSGEVASAIQALADIINRERVKR